MIIAGTGHRPHKLGGEYELDGPVTRSVSEVTRLFLLDRKPDQVVSGMAIGFDTILALVAIELKIPVIAAVPFKGQESRWPEKSQRRYREILDDPYVTTWIVSPGGFNSHKLQVRNEAMVKRAGLILACWDGSYGGTRNCIDYALEVGRPVFRFRPGSTVIEELRPDESEATL